MNCEGKFQIRERSATLAGPLNGQAILLGIFAFSHFLRQCVQRRIASFKDFFFNPGSAFFKRMPSLFSLCLLSTPIASHAAFFSSQDDLRISSALGQRFSALLVLSEDFLSQAEMDTECLHALLRQQNGRLISQLEVSRATNGLHLRSRAPIKYADSRLSIRSSCAPFASTELQIYLAINAPGKVSPAPIANNAGEVLNTNTARLAERAARLAQTKARMQALAEVGQSPAANAANTNTAIKLASESTLTPTAAKELATAAANKPQAELGATTENGLDQKSSNLAQMKIRIYALEEKIANLRRQIGPDQAWWAKPANFAWAGVVMALLLGTGLLLTWRQRQRAEVADEQDERVEPLSSRASPYKYSASPSTNTAKKRPQTSKLDQHIGNDTEELGDIIFAEADDTLDADEYDFGKEIMLPSTSLSAPTMKDGNQRSAVRPSDAKPQNKLAAQQKPSDFLLDEDILFATEMPGPSTILEAEEMTDALQEAKFWIALQRPYSAIAVLEEEIKRDASAPGNWLALLDVLRQVHEQEKFSTLRDEFHRRFNGQIPPWEQELSVDKIPRLEDFPRISEQINAVLNTEQAIPYLESLLLDDRDGTREGFAYGVYCDLVQIMENLKRGHQEMTPSF